MGVGGHRYAPAALLQRKSRGIHYGGGNVGPRADLDVYGEYKIPYTKFRTLDSPACSESLYRLPYSKLRNTDRVSRITDTNMGFFFQ